ncbi:hypothetical protein [Actinacidiphila sp. ITFR-21]|uniref:hypothetical protein n=1 Tax=Actinacidiphila sp. ITFR-21 TaxID=3075199 RepID=UPI00288A8414|nr:hypothetical protein [Streptomyces sp. ITFR-21]WNI16298.1 hypothetical protein RLT57_12705 [Streptomyces sp. ITFR-21]
MAGEAGEGIARARALAVLRVRSTALSAALLPAAAAVVLHVGRGTGRLGPAWDDVCWAVTGAALVVLAVAAAVGAVIVRARPAVSPTVPVAEKAAPDLYRMVRDLAERLAVPVPSAIALTPDCDSWLEERRGAAPAPGGGWTAPVLVVGSPFVWWMRVAELRALLAPVVAGTGPAADPEIAAARRFLRGLDAAAGVAADGARGALPLRPVFGALGRVVRLLLHGCRTHAAEMERGVAASASERALAVDYGLRTVAQEQVGLAYAGWDRLLTRVALPAWRMGRWPSRLDAGVVAALTELSRRDRLAEGFETRLGEQPACDLLEEPGVVDEAVSLLAARIFHGGPARPGPGWAPVSWARYPEEVVAGIWRAEAGRLIRLLDDARPAPVRGRVLVGGRAADAEGAAGVTLADVIDRLASGAAEELAARLSAEAEAEARAAAAAGRPTTLAVPGGEVAVCPLLPPRTGRELLTDHVTAVVCCAAVDTVGATAGLDWLDGPTLHLGGSRRTDLAAPIHHLVETADPAPLLTWLTTTGIHPTHLLRCG